MATPGENTARDGKATAGAPAGAPKPASTPSAGQSASAAGTPPQGATPAAAAPAEREDSTWIYAQLGLSEQEYKSDPAPDATAMPSGMDMARKALLDLDLDSLRPNAPGESPFPPGSLGGGKPDPPTRKFDGFPAPGSGAGLAGAAKLGPGNAGRPVSDRGVPERAQPGDADNPFRIYDERQATGDIELPAHRPAPPARGAIIPPESKVLSADSLTAEKVLKQRRPPPGRGWRKGLLMSTGINLGPSPKELTVAGFEDRVRTVIPGCHQLAVISLKGGVGKTTTAAALGSVFASVRGDRVIAIDANPDRGTLGDKIVSIRKHATVREFVARASTLDRYSAVREFTAQAESRLEVLASESDPMSSLAFSENDYRIISDVLERFYNLILTDCGTGLLHSAMVGVLAKTDQVVIVSSASLDGARSASATLDWLEAHGYGELAKESVTVVTSVRPRADAVQLDEIVDHFARRTRAVVAVPYDPHLAEGGQINLARLSKGAYQAYLELAAEVADVFPNFAS
ncbi:MAG: MinD/ParA family ATP-binding protein [Sporichthyaceae bacterium]